MIWRSMKTERPTDDAEILLFDGHFFSHCITRPGGRLSEMWHGDLVEPSDELWCYASDLRATITQPSGLGSCGEPMEKGA